MNNILDFEFYRRKLPKHYQNNIDCKLSFFKKTTLKQNFEIFFKTFINLNLSTVLIAGNVIEFYKINNVSKNLLLPNSFQRFKSKLEQHNVIIPLVLDHDENQIIGFTNLFKEDKNGLMTCCHLIQNEQGNGIINNLFNDIKYFFSINYEVSDIHRSYIQDRDYYEVDEVNIIHISISKIPAPNYNQLRCIIWNDESNNIKFLNSSNDLAIEYDILTQEKEYNNFGDYFKNNPDIKLSKLFIS